MLFRQQLACPRWGRGLARPFIGGGQAFEPPPLAHSRQELRRDRSSFTPAARSTNRLAGDRKIGGRASVIRSMHRPCGHLRAFPVHVAWPSAAAGTGSHGMRSAISSHA